MADQSAPAEPYRSLYRRFRPQRFEDVRGQEHVTRALRNAVRDARVAHAYLFSGPRGTGKTSTARILAMALNCEQPVDGEPDGTCASCVEIRKGSSLDVHELDAASNRRLDEMRELLSRVALGSRSRWKVYIVDEVHQLTADASSALLKTLEEPPGHVVFVLATTDPQKVLPTIRSRTQHYEFRLLGSEVLGGLLRDVSAEAGLGLAPEAIDLVVRRGHGSARDALSALDQVAALGHVEDESGLVGGIVDAVAEHDPGRVLVAVAEAASAGRDPRRLATDLIEHLRNGFLASQARSLVLLPDDAAAEVERQARQIGLPGIVRSLELLGDAVVAMRDAADPRVTLEVALVRLAAPADDPGSLLTRIEHLEREVAALTAGSPPPAGRAEQLQPRRAEPSQSRPAEPSQPRPAEPSQSRPAEPTLPRPAGASGPRPAVPPSRPSTGDPPPLPGRRPATAETAGGAAPARPALGAIRKGTAGPDPTPGPGAQAAAPQAAAPRAAAPPAGPAPTSGQPPAPSRDELTKAWGDHVLPALPARVRAYLSAGRFVEGGGGPAVYAVPDDGLLSRAKPLQGEVEAALAAHFGRPVPLRLVVERDVAPPVAAPPEDDPGAYELETLDDAGPAVVSPEQRVLDAFPGAKEVAP